MENHCPCPLCKSENLTLVERIENEDLNQLYIKKFNFSVDYLFKESVTNLLKCNNCDLMYYSPQVGGDEAFYNMLQKYPWYYTKDKEEYRYAKTLITPEDSILEIGSGSGTFAAYIPNNQYLGLEFSDNAISMAASSGIKVINQTVEAHAEENPNTYDVAVAFQVLEHVIEIQEFLMAAVKTLKTKGKLIISVPAEGSFMQRINNDILNFPPHHSTRYTDQVFHNMQAILGVKLVSLKHQPLEPIHKRLFLKTNIYHTLLKLTGKKFRRIDNSGFAKFLDMKAFGLAIFCAPFYKFKPIEGHTITVMFEKL